MLPPVAGSGGKLLRLDCRVDRELPSPPKTPVWNICVPREFIARGSVSLNDLASKSAQQAATSASKWSA